MDQKYDSGLLVIGTGLPRTGTTSLWMALQILGFGPCHHFKPDVVDEPFPYPNGRLWQEACGTEDKHERQRILHQIYASGGYRSVTDYPSSSFVEDLVEMYPEAKFIHCERSSPELWRKSFNETIGRLQYRICSYPAMLLPVFALSLRHILAGLDARAKRLGGALYGPLDGVELYHAHNAHVHRVVPNDRLLIFDAKQGYTPLCEFLGVPVPRDEQGRELAYPYVNDRKEITKIINGFIMFCWMLGGALLVGSFFGVRSGLLQIPRWLKL